MHHPLNIWRAWLAITAIACLAASRLHRRVSASLGVSGALAAFFVMASAALATHPFPALNNTGTTAATSFRTPLVPAYKPCKASDQGGTPDSTHSGLPGDSCSTTGAAGLVSAVVKPGPKSIAWAQISLKNPNTANVDVAITGSATDVRCKIANATAGCSAIGADYNPNTAAGPYTTPGSGRVTPPTPPCTSAAACFSGRDMTATGEMPLQKADGMPVDPGTVTEYRTIPDRAVHVTDHYNARKTAAACNTQGSPPPNCLGTTQDEPLPVPVVCTPTADTTIGSDCGVNTTANSLIPGAVVNGKRAVVEGAQIQVYDSGLNGVADFLTTTGDDRIVVKQGITIP
jgi:hypothetical protein